MSNQVGAAYIQGTHTRRREGSKWDSALGLWDIRVWNGSGSICIALASVAAAAAAAVFDATRIPLVTKNDARRGREAMLLVHKIEA